MADRFIKGTLILTAAGLMVKILASVNRIFLSRLLGGEGIGLYQLAYPLFNLLTGIAAAGIPAAMSLFVSQWAAKKEWGKVRHFCYDGTGMGCFCPAYDSPSFFRRHHQGRAGPASHA